MHILILDDAELNNVLVLEALRGLPGCRPVAFTRPDQALLFIESAGAEIGVALTDYEMPGMTGVEFIRAARRIAGFQHVPVIMVTGMNARNVRRESLEAGATDFLGKPFDPIEIRARVSNLLALSKARRDQEDRATWLAREVAAATSVIAAREREIVTRLALAAEHRDTDTGDHITRVSRYAAKIAVALGCDPGWCERLGLASTMHDVGKIAVPDAILLKRGPLTPDERVTIERHAESGYKILEGSSSDVIRLAAEVAVSHHERWDGAGYPKGLKGEDIPLGGRIVAVADVFDALVTERPYKQAWSWQKARDYLLENAGTQFDPQCVGAFLSVMPGLGPEAGATLAA